MAKRIKGKKSTTRSRRLSLKAAVILTVLAGVWAVAGDWFVHHPRVWLAEARARYGCLTKPLYLIGNPVGDLTDALGWTGNDAVYDYDAPAPNGSVAFAGLPVRTGAPAPADIRVLDRGAFEIGWSDTLKHPVWCAYHVPRQARFENLKRPGFTRDKSVPAAPSPDAYKGSGFDRGHMVPNYAMVTRFGEEIQRLTFKMSNIAPQAAALNRAVWREFEHRIADLWTARWGEIWVVAGCFTPRDEKPRRIGDIDIPRYFYQVIVAQEGLDVRALAVVFPQDVPWDAWAARHIVSIDTLEEMTGLDFNPKLESFIQDPLEAEVPTRLWPVRLADVARILLIRYAK